MTDWNTLTRDEINDDVDESIRWKAGKKFEVGDLVVVTGPLSLDGEEGNVYLYPNEAGEVVKLDELGPVRVYGFFSDLHQWIDATSLTLLSEVEVQFDPDYVHDYTNEGDDK
jgi:hypothetical protein